MILTSKQKSQRSEKQAAKLYKGRTQMASGAISHSKGDVRTARYLIEDKITDKQSYAVTRKVWDKIAKEGLQVGKQPLLRITINGKTLIVCDEVLFLTLADNEL